MKQIIIILFTIISSLSAFAVRKYDIVETYEITQAPKDSKAVNAYGVVTNAKYILTPSKINYGEYSVELSKIGWRDRSMLGQHGSHKTVPRSAI